MIFAALDALEVERPKTANPRGIAWEIANIQHDKKAYT